MGHDIYAHDPNSEFELDTEYAYLRRSAFSPDKFIIYDVFDSKDYYGGCSGTGETVIYTKLQVERALEKLKIKYSDKTEEQLFINCCLKNLDENNKIAISYH
jgi:hypothetical protein